MAVTKLIACIVLSSLVAGAAANDGTQSLAYAVYLPDEDVAAPQVETHQFLVLDDDCTREGALPAASSKFVDYDSMSHLVTSMAIDVGLSGSYKEAVFSMSGSVHGRTGTTSDTRSTFHSVELRLMNPAKAVQVKDTCITKDKIEENVLQAFTILPLPTVADDGFIADGSWAAYNRFLGSHGSHIIKTNIIGSAFFQWVSTTNEVADVTNTLRARACVEVEGISVSQDAPGLAPCAGFNSSERAESSSISSTARRVILGGTEATRNSLQTASPNDIDANIAAFLAAADQSTAVISARYKPVWEIFYEAFQYDCATGDSEACSHLQRANLLEAAYMGWQAYECHQRTSAGIVYQGLKYYPYPDSYGVHNVLCFAKKTGCSNDDDCDASLLGLFGCYAAGHTAFDAVKIEGTDLYSTIVRQKAAGSSPTDGINDSCKSFLGCTCDTLWSQGQERDDRAIWQTAERFGSVNPPPPTTTESPTPVCKECSGYDAGCDAGEVCEREGRRQLRFGSIQMGCCRAL